MSNIDSLIKCLEQEKIKRDEPLSLHTSLGVGGKADLFYTTSTSGDLVKAVRLARSFNVPVNVIGEGGGVVVSDTGLRGLVICNKSERIQVKPQKNIFDFFRKREIKKAEVIIDSGVGVENAMKKLHSLGIVGFEKFASYTGSIGAMVSNGEGKEFLRKMSVLDEHGGVKSLGVDKAIGKNIVMDATYILSYGKISSCIRRKFSKKRSVQKVFEDINEEERQVLGYPVCDAGYIVGEVLNLKGFKIGKMKVSLVNQNEIINTGKGKAGDFVALVEEIKRRSRETIGIELIEKVMRLGDF